MRRFAGCVRSGVIRYGAIPEHHLKRNERPLVSESLTALKVPDRRRWWRPSVEGERLNWHERRYTIPLAPGDPHTVCHPAVKEAVPLCQLRRVRRSSTS